MRQNRATHVSLCSAGKQWIENPLVLSILRCLLALSLGAHGCRAAARSGRLLDDLVCLLSSTTIERNAKGVLDASTSIRILLLVLKCRSSEQHFSYSFPAYCQTMALFSQSALPISIVMKRERPRCISPLPPNLVMYELLERAILLCLPVLV